MRSGQPLHYTLFFSKRLNMLGQKQNFILINTIPNPGFSCLTVKSKID